MDAWIRMKEFGNHPGDCDNVETCTECGTAKAGCSIHANWVKIRMKAMDKAVESLSSAIRQDPGCIFILKEVATAIRCGQAERNEEYPEGHTFKQSFGIEFVKAIELALKAAEETRRSREEAARVHAGHVLEMIDVYNTVFDHWKQMKSVLNEGYYTHDNEEMDDRLEALSDAMKQVGKY